MQSEVGNIQEQVPSGRVEGFLSSFSIVRDGENNNELFWVDTVQLVHVCKAWSLTALVLVENGRPLPVTLHVKLIALEMSGI